jgi:ActR/RegA family two-component response regulator
MTESSSLLPTAILYVDDEAKALKYFERAYSRSFTIFTAEGPEDGLRLLNEHADKIGIIVSDQRMPKITGVEFLSQVRKHYPSKVRILTTAYSDLDSAIQSVNEGHIYQYVVKPWDIQDFGLTLKRAAEYYMLLRERNQLMSIKMHTLQRIILTDRIKSLLVMAEAVGAPLSQTIPAAIHALLKALPTFATLDPDTGSFTTAQFSVGELMREEKALHLNLLSQLRRELTVADLATESSAEGIGLTRNEGSSLQIEISAGKMTEVFGLFSDRTPSPLALKVFHLAATAALGNQNLEIQESGAAADKSIHLPTGTKADSDAVSSQLDQLYSYWDTLTLGLG